MSEIGTQQLDFLGNCQCRLSFLDNMHKEARAQVPIFDTVPHKWDIICQIMWGLGHCYDTLFRGSLKHKQGIWGYHIALHFQLLTTINSWGIFISIVSQPTQTCAHARLVFCY